MTTYYSVGPDKIDEKDSGYLWVVYSYEIGCYSGDGEAISFDGQHLREHSLSHCSCYGPEDGLSDGDIIKSLDDPSVHAYMSDNPLVLTKAKEVYDLQVRL